MRSRRMLLVVGLIVVGLLGCGKDEGLSDREENTGIEVKAGSTVHITATGTVDFGGAAVGIGAPKLDADGDSEPTPANYPAPALRKNSLICRVGNSIWYQGGTDKTFVPTQDGNLICRPNDAKLEDNSRGWKYKVEVTPHVEGKPLDYGPFAINKQEVDTHIIVPLRSSVQVTVNVGDLIDFGGAVSGIGAPRLNADGDSEPAPSTYPVPGLRKNSLIVRVGSVWFQGGTDKMILPAEAGPLILRPNDGTSEDNSGAWNVAVRVTPLPDSVGQPGSSQGFGEFPVSNQELNTRVPVKAGFTVHLNVNPGDQVDFGGAIGGIGAPKLNADGDSYPAPPDYPAPELRKNSLIARVGSVWYQGGVDKTFVPTEDGTLLLRPNDPQMEDNTRGWRVRVEITPPATAGTTPGQPATRTYGPFPISNHSFNTNIFVKAGTTVRVTADGIIDFGGAVLGVGAPKLGPDGDDSATPKNYPAPDMRKNSLLCAIGETWYQGGSDKTFLATSEGTLYLQPNDNHLADNSRGWQVTVTIQ